MDKRMYDNMVGGAKIAFGDPKLKTTRYEVHISNAMRRGGKLSTSRHLVGKAADVQIWDREKKQYIGGSNSIFKNALGNPHTYPAFLALARGRLAHAQKVGGKEFAKQIGFGGNFNVGYSIGS